MAIGYTDTLYPPDAILDANARGGPGPGIIIPTPEGGFSKRYTFEYTPVPKEIQEAQMRAQAAATQPGGSGGMDPVTGFNMGEAVNQLGMDQAEQAMIAATRFQGQRGYQQDLQNGVTPDKALAKWAPLMYFSKSATGAAGMMNALAPKPDYQYVPGANGAPATYQAAGQRPVVVPQSALPQSEGTPELIVEEIAPGLSVVRDPRSKSLHIVPTNKGALTESQQQNMDLRRMGAQLTAAQLAANSSEDSESYKVATNVLAQLQAPRGAQTNAAPSVPMATDREAVSTTKAPTGEKRLRFVNGKLMEFKNGKLIPYIPQ